MIRIGGADRSYLEESLDSSCLSPLMDPTYKPRFLQQATTPLREQ